MTKASEIMEKEVITGSENERISQIISKMEQKDIKEIPIIEDGELKGIVTYYDIIGTYTPGKLKAKSIMARPSGINHDSSIEETIRKMVNSGLEALPVTRGGEVVGIVSEYDILKYLLEEGELRKYRLKDFLVEVPALKPDDLISKARTIMRKNKVSRLPVVDQNGKYIGLVLLIDILRISYKQISPREGKPYKSSYKNFLENPVKNFIKEVPRVKKDEKLEEVVGIILEEGLKGLSVLDEEGKPLGIFSRLQLFHEIAQRYQDRGIRVTISGEVDWEIEESMKNLIKNYGRKLKYFTKINQLKIRLKRVHDAEGKSKYEIKLKVRTPGFSIGVEEVGFDILYTLKRGLEKLERRLRDEFYERESHEKK